MEIPITIRDLDELAIWCVEAKPKKIIIHHEHPLLDTKPFRGQKKWNHRAWRMFNSIPIEYK